MAASPKIALPISIQELLHYQLTFFVTYNTTYCK